MQLYIQNIIDLVDRISLNSNKNCKIKKSIKDVTFN